MKFFIDTANLSQIQEAQDLGVLDGVTTNPSLMVKEGITGKTAILKHYTDICTIVEGDVSAEVNISPIRVFVPTVRWYSQQVRRFWQPKQGLLTCRLSSVDSTISQPTVFRSSRTYVSFTTTTISRLKSLLLLSVIQCTSSNVPK